MQSKDIAGCPTKRFCLFALLRQETLAVLVGETVTVRFTRSVNAYA